jgi:BolA family transcriptional regulator, general stress-responsive regulator
MSNLSTLEKIQKILSEAFQPTFLQVKDDSARHAGHAGAQKGGGHYQVEVISATFEGLSSIEQHRRVHEALRELIGDKIHALQLKTGSSSSEK